MGTKKSKKTSPKKVITICVSDMKRSHSITGNRTKVNTPCFQLLHARKRSSGTSTDARLPVIDIKYNTDISISMYIDEEKSRSKSPGNEENVPYEEDDAGKFADIRS